MLDKDFDALLEVSLPETPPSDMVDAVTPWRTAFDRVLWGMALTSITLNFLWLDYILPFIGIVMMVLGFRALRRENIWFFFCWFVSLLRLATNLTSLILNATVFHENLLSERWNYILTGALLAAHLLQLICLWLGFRAVRRKAGLQPKAASAVALIFWYCAIVFLVISGCSGLFLGIPLVIVYVLIIRCLYQLSKGLDEAGYTIHTAPILVSDPWLKLGITGLLIFGIACGYLFFSRYPMDWKETALPNNEQTEEVISKLVDLGFPEYVLADMTEDDILACANAQRVVSDTSQEEGGLSVTGVGVELQNERETWKIFHHFQWSADSTLMGTDSIIINPTYQLDGWSDGGGLSGQVCFDQSETTFTAPFYALYDSSYPTMFGTNYGLFAQFSFPNGAKNQRGYLSYTVQETVDGCIISSWFDYLHQVNRWQYPLLTDPAKQRSSAGWGNMDNYHMIQDALQFYPTEESIEMIS